MGQIELQPLTAWHIERLERIVSDPRVAQNAGFSWPPEADWGQAFWTTRSAAVERGDAVCFVLTHAAARVVGHAALFDLKRYTQAAELCVWLDQAYWGQGCGSAAVCAVLDYAVRQLGLEQVYARYSPHNARAYRLLRRCGFQSDSTWMVGEGDLRRDLARGLRSRLAIGERGAARG